MSATRWTANPRLVRADSRSASRGSDVPEEDYGGPAGQAGEPRACRRQLIKLDGHEDDVIFSAGLKHHGGVGLGPPPAAHIASAKAQCGNFVGSRAVAQH